MHSLKTLLQLPCGWRCSRQIISSGGITLHLHGKRKTAQCPECFKRSDSVHSCRRRRIQHLPCSGQTLWLVFSVRHWYCRNPACHVKFLPSRLLPSPVHTSSLHRRYKIYNVKSGRYLPAPVQIYIYRGPSVSAVVFSAQFFSLPAQYQQ